METSAQGRAPSTVQSKLTSTTSTQPQDFQLCLKQYAVAALGVAGVSTLASAQAPATHIVYTPANIALTEPFPGTVVPIDFNHDGVADITVSLTGFYQAFSGHGGSAQASMFEQPAPGNIAIGGHAIPFGVALSQAGAFRSNKFQMAFTRNFSLATSSIHQTDTQGPFANVTNKYLGVKFKIAGQFHYGWIRLSMSCSRGFCTGKVTGYAFNSIANQSITAGQLHPTAGGKAAVEVPAGSLGMLAAGARAISNGTQ